MCVTMQLHILIKCTRIVCQSMPEVLLTTYPHLKNVKSGQCTKGISPKLCVATGRDSRKVDSASSAYGKKSQTPICQQGHVTGLCKARKDPKQEQVVTAQVI